MPTYLPDTLRTLELIEEGGAIQSMVRTGQVKGLTGTDPQALSEALATSGVPAVNSVPTGYTNLRLVKREARIMTEVDAKDRAELTLTYLPYGLDGINLVFNVDAATSQVTTNKDAFGNALSVSYTFPAGYKPDPNLAGQTVTTGVSANVHASSHTIQGEGNVTVANPLSITSLFLNAVNAFYWNGGAAGSWRCSNVTARPLDLSVNKWRFGFTFQHNPFLWNSYVWFTDPNTGEPPSDLVLNTGIKQVAWYPEVHFAAYIRML